jgi:hypothetical protein
MRRASFAEGIEWIAFNDEPLDMDAEHVAEQPTTLLLADLFDEEPIDVAEKIVDARRKLDARLRKGEIPTKSPLQ